MNAQLLARRLASGDRGALEECYATYGRLLRSYLARLVGPNDAEDVLQETFASLWHSARQLDANRSLEVWLLVIARRRAIDHLRKRRRLDTAGPVPPPAPLPADDPVDRISRALQVQQALAELPEEQQHIVRLAYFEDLTQAVIAERLKLPVNTVKTRLFRALRRLGARLREEDWR
jgi:RNA polymerase sigma factor (sigma-70 family)